MKLLIAIQKEIPDWYDEAQCIGSSTEIFFPQVGGKGESVHTAKMVSLAKSICQACVVREVCLRHAIETNEKEGIWGGKTFRERKRLRTVGAGRK